MFACRRLLVRVSSSCLLFLLLGCATAFAQFDSASVVGTVRDTSGAVVPGAKVTLTNTETGISIVKASSGDGNYEFTAVKPGTYVVTAEKTGFSAVTTYVPGL